MYNVHCTTQDSFLTNIMVIKRIIGCVPMCVNDITLLGSYNKHNITSARTELIFFFILKVGLMLLFVFHKWKYNIEK